MHPSLVLAEAQVLGEPLRVSWMEMEVVLQEQVSSTLCPVGSQSDPRGSKAIKDEPDAGGRRGRLVAVRGDGRDS
jgi:hypothetical protein